MTTIQCAVSDCTSSVSCKGFCPKHYQRMRRSGHPELVARQCRECASRFTYTPTKGRRRMLCDDCVVRLQRERVARYNHRQSRAAAGDDPEYLIRLRTYQFRANIRRYGITPEQFDELLASQAGRCAICGETPDPDGKGAYSRLHIDHCHETGLVRGLLCGRCNAALGHFRDDPGRLAAAINYLNEKSMKGSAA